METLIPICYRWGLRLGDMSMRFSRQRSHMGRKRRMFSPKISIYKTKVSQAWGVFLAYYMVKLTFPGTTHLEYALIGGLSISQALLVSPLVASSNLRFGPRITLLVGTALVHLSLLRAVFATEIWHLFLSQGLFFGYG